MMSFEVAQRMTEVLLAVAFLQHCAEHIFGGREDRVLFAVRAGLSLALLFGLYVPLVVLALTAHSLLVLHRFQGPYNGGSDRMGLLILYCLTLSHWLPSGAGPEIAMGYLGVQVILSYVVSGQVKIVNPAWRSGQALQDVFAFSAYPVSEQLRSLADRPRLLWWASWLVILFEVLFPLGLLHPAALICALCVAALFHTANALLFELNRFVYAWIAGYPAVIWLQGRLVLGGGV